MIIPKNIIEAKNLFQENKLTPTELVKHYLNVINEKNPKINAVLEVFESSALESAKESEKRFRDNTQRELEGIPFLIKDCILTEGHIASAGSKMLEKFVAPYDATSVKLLKEAGAIILGRTNMDEFALGGSGENSAYGKTLNPLDETRVPGGSSSGSAAAIASGMTLMALGSDTGGSVRQPASLCGVYGYKPTYGGISRFGLIAAASSLDTIGIFGNDISDIEIVQNILYKHDTFDATSIPDSVRAEKSKKTFAKSVAYPKKYIESEGIDEEVKKNFFENIDKLKSLGYTVNPVSIDSLKYALSVYYIINTAEVSTNLSRMEGLRFGGGELTGVNSYEDLFSKSREAFFGPEVKRRIILGTFVLSHGYFDAYYGKAQIIREQMKSDFEKVFSDNSIIIMPTAPTTAFVSGEKKDPLTLYLEDIFTVPANLVGIPAISIPSGHDTKNLPFSLQALANFGRDTDLFDFTKDFTK